MGKKKRKNRKDAHENKKRKLSPNYLKDSYNKVLERKK